MSDFEEAAKAYCKNRVEWLSIRRAMAATPCEWGDDADSRPCWLAIEHEDNFNENDFCEACAGNTHHRERRAELGKKMAWLMKKMLTAYRVAR